MADAAPPRKVDFGAPVAAVRRSRESGSDKHRSMFGRAEAAVRDKGGKEALLHPSVQQLSAHVTGLRRYALMLSGNSVDADDLVQETLAKVLVQLKSWNEVRDLRSYLFTVLHNVYIDDTRRSARFKHAIPIDDAVSLLSTPATQQKRLEIRDLTIALAKLPLDQRQVVLLVGFEGMSYTEAASTLGIPIGTVMSRLSRGRETLRKLMDRKPQAKLRVVK